MTWTAASSIYTYGQIWAVKICPLVSRYPVYSDNVNFNLYSYLPKNQCLDGFEDDLLLLR